MAKISNQRDWLSWTSVVVLAVLCGVLGVLQYRSIGEIAAAERNRLYEAVRGRLDAAGRAFDERISSACSAVLQSPREFVNRQPGRGHLFRRIALVEARREGLVFMALDETAGQFVPAEWPAGWEAIRGELMDPRAGPPHAGLVFAFPGFGPPGSEWLLVELDADYLRTAVLPQLVDEYIAEDGKLDYDVVVVSEREPSAVIYQMCTAQQGTACADLVSSSPDASVPLLMGIRANGTGRGRGRGPRGGRRGPGGPPPGFDGPGGWRLLVRSRAGSIDALVRQTQRRSLAISASILGLILATVLMLVRFSRQAQRLAELQINFVAGVSHEFRTPLTVIRTAGYNLRGARIRNAPDQVERYGRLIESESEKLEKLVEDVLRFASAEAGHVIRGREPVRVNNLIEKTLESRRGAIESAGVLLEERVGSGLPVVLADELALRHALQNLIDNAVKYGTEGGNWIGVYAEAVVDERGSAVEIRVADHGPGIPAGEIPRLFDPFFRGNRAVQDQMHGTGLGLSLAKTIIEAHGGSIEVRSKQPGGSEFIIRIPAAPLEFQDELAHIAG